MSKPSSDWAACFSGSGRSLRRVALVTATWFLAIGALWIVALDVVLRAESHDPVTTARLESTIHWAFILIASAAIYAIAFRVATQLKHMHDVTSAVVESIGDGVFLLGADRKIAYANPAGARMLRLGQDEFIGMTAPEFWRRFRPSYPDGLVVAPDELISQRAFTEPGPLRYKVVLHFGEHEGLVFRSTAAAVRRRLGEPPAMVVSVLHDITPNENLSRMRDRFFAAAAHALKTPVAVIKANVQLISRGPHADTPSFRAIERQCARIDQLVKNLMVVSRARSHSLHLHAHAIELEPIVRDVAAEIVAARPTNEVRVEVSASPQVFGDRERLATLVRNLFSEAAGIAVRGTPLAICLGLHEPGTAEIGVRYVPIPVAERTFAGEEQYDDAPLARCATMTIADAHGGRVGEDNAETASVLWARFPTIEDHDAAV